MKSFLSFSLILGALSVSLALTSHAALAQGATDTPQTNGEALVVNSADDHDDGTCGVTDCTLREAIGFANGDGIDSAISFGGVASSAILVLQKP